MHTDDQAHCCVFFPGPRLMLPTSPCIRLSSPPLPPTPPPSPSLSQHHYGTAKCSRSTPNTPNRPSHSPHTAQRTPPTEMAAGGAGVERSPMHRHTQHRRCTIAGGCWWSGEPGPGPWVAHKSTTFKVAPHPQRPARRLAHPEAVLAFHSQVQKPTQSSRTVRSSPWKSPLK